MTGSAQCWTKPAKYIIPLHDFTQLANFIAKKRPRIDVPPSLISTLNRLITLRAGFAKLLAQHGQAFNSESEARHQHFMNALKDVRSILQPHPSVETEEQSKPASEDDKTPKPPGGGLMNRFSALSVDEPSQGFLERFSTECDHAARPLQLAGDASVFEAGLEKPEEELMFLCSALLRDLNEIRPSNHPMWPQKETTWDPAAFAISTNVAISLDRGLIDEVEPLLEKAKAGSLFMMETMASVMEKTAQDTAEPMPPAPGSPSDSMHEVVKRIRDPHFLILLATRFDLSKPCRMQWPSAMGLLSPPTMPIILISLICPGFVPREDWFDQDALLIEHYFCGMMLVLQTMGGFPVEDELFRAARGYNNTNKLSISLVFAFQIFLDINRLTEQSFPPISSREKPRSIKIYATSKNAPGS